MDDQEKLIQTEERKKQKTNKQTTKNCKKRLSLLATYSDLLILSYPNQTIPFSPPPQKKEINKNDLISSLAGCWIIPGLVWLQI